MGNAYDNASLLVTPNGYKASKIYSAKPTDGTGDLAFSRASTAMRRNSAGLWEEVANNVPRLQYPVGGGCPSWLFEPQATNLITYSNSFNSGTWQLGLSGAGAVSITNNSGTAPDGTTTAALINCSRAVSTENAAIVYPNATGLNTYSGSIFLKAKDAGNVGKKINLWAWEGVLRGFIEITLTADWVRYENSFTFSIVGSELFDFGFLTSSVGGSTDLNAEFYAWNAQTETGSVATSPIITAGSAVTRLADVASKTSATALIGQTEGTIFIEASNKILGQSDRFLFAVNDDAFDNVIFLNYTSAAAETIRFFVIANGGIGALAFKSVIDPVLKAVVTYKNGVYKFFYNGEIQHTQSGNSFSANLENIFLGCNAFSSQQIGEGIKPIIFYPTALSDAEAIELSTI